MKHLLTPLLIILVMQTSAFAQKLQLDRESKAFNTKTTQYFEQQKSKHRNAKTLREKEKLENAKSHLKHGDYFQIKKTNELPQDLKWTSGNPQPTIGDARAKKGGIVRFRHLNAPNTLRSFGPESNSSTRGILYDEIDLSLLSQHPVTKEYMPCLARSWAISEDHKTVYFKLNKAASYSDGIRVEAIDYVVFLILRCHEFAQSPFHSQYFTKLFTGITLYDDILAIHLTKRNIDPLSMANFSPSPKHFYTDFGKDFITTYDRKFPPTTGAYLYDVKKSDRSVSILNKVKNWWAKDLPQFKYAFNPDKIVYYHNNLATVATGEIDIQTILPTNRYLKQSEAFKKGYVNFTSFQNQTPRLPRGYYLNTANPHLADIRVRQALQYAFSIEKAMKSIKELSRYKRLNQFCDGYGTYTKAKIKARPYSQKKCAILLTKAGYTKNKDGFWLDKNGDKLSFKVSYTNSNNPLFQALQKVIQDQAKECGIDIQLSLSAPSDFYRKLLEKQHDIIFSAWGVIGPHPRYFQFFHSSNAYHSDGTVKKQTNNINNYSNAKLDRLIEQYRTSYEPVKHRKLAHQIQQHIHDEAIFIPTFKYDHVDIAYSNWIQWPNSKTTTFSPINVVSPVETYLWWVDEDIKRATLKAINEKKSLRP